MKVSRIVTCSALAMLLICGALLSPFLSTFGANVAVAQEMQHRSDINFDVTLELAEIGTITVPVQINAPALCGLMNFPPANAAVHALAQLNGQSLATPKPSPTAIPDAQAADNELVVQAPTTFGADTSRDAPVAVTPLALNAGAGSAQTTEPSVTNANAYQRLDPSTDAPILGQLPAESEVFVDGRNADGEWLHLADGSWVARFLLDNVPATLPIIVDGASRGEATVTGTITGDSVILREGPSQSNDMVDMYNTGMVIAVLSRASSGDWLEVVTADGSVGWMSSEYLELDGDIADLDTDLESLPVVETVGDRDIYGAVVDAAGLGVDNAIISTVPTDGPSDGQLFATSAEDGSFIITVPDNGMAEWSVWIDNLACESRLMNDRCQLFGYYLATPNVEIELPLDEPLELHYADATSFIAGTVVDANGVPRGAGIIVTAFREDGAMTEGSTASSGKFVLPADAGSWEISTEYGPSMTVEVEAGSAPDPIEVPSE